MTCLLGLSAGSSESALLIIGLIESKDLIAMTTFLRIGGHFANWQRRH